MVPAAYKCIERHGSKLDAQWATNDQNTRNNGSKALNPIQFLDKNSKDLLTWLIQLLGSNHEQ